MLDAYWNLRSWNRWELVGLEGLGMAPGRMGGSAGEVRAEGLRSGVLPPEAWLCAWGFCGGRGSAGAVLAGSVLWLLGATWAPRPDRGGVQGRAGLRGAGCRCRDLSGSGSAWARSPRGCPGQGAAGVKALRPSKELAWVPKGRRCGTGAPWTAGPYRWGRETRAGRTVVWPKRGP